MNRLLRLRLLARLFLVGLLLAPAVGARAALEAVTTPGMTVTDMERALEFFALLGFAKVSDVEVAGEPFERLQGLFGLRMRVVRLRLGAEEIELTEYLAPPGRAIPDGQRSNDRSFQHVAIVVADMERAYAELRRARVRHVSSGPQQLPESIPAAAGIRAFYFRDPDGHNLELIWYPAGKGDPRWQRDPGEALFLGIDHTAIVVSDTERSLRFYRDALGLRVAGESLNAGTEQEHLNNVFGARLRITGLRAPSGPGIEFLEYLSPSDGRPAPADLQPNDALYWLTTLRASEPRELESALRRLDARFLSPGMVELPDGELGFRRGFVVRDPDGHALRVVR